MEDSEMPLTEHLEELRSCILRAGVGLLVGFAVCYYYADPIIAYLQKPLFEVLPPDQRKLYFTNPIEKFVVYIKMSVVAGIALSSPWILYQIWRFIGPGLKLKEKNFVTPLILGGSLLFLIGGVFAFYLVIPTGLRVLMSFGGSMDGALITYTSYFNVILMMILVFGVVFQVPLILFLAVSVGILKVSVLRQKRPYIYVGMSVASALLTPPDPFTMMAMFIPMACLFELTLILLAWKK